MGLMGIHDPDAFRCYTGYTNCPWCAKEGQYEGTVVNHLRTTHYRLGLVCDWCFGCPTVMSDSLLAWEPKLPTILCCIWIRSVQLTYLPNQELYQEASVGLSYQTPFPLEGQRTQQIKHYLPVHQIHLLFSSGDQGCLRKMLLIASSTLTGTDYSQGSVHKNW